MEYNLTNVVVERPTKTVYKDGNKIVKLFKENYSKAQILNEALNHARVEENTDLNIPKLIEVSTIGNQTAIVIENIEGQTLESLIEQNPEKIDEYLNIFVNLQLQVLSKSVPMLSLIKEKFKRKLNQANIDDATRYELTHRLEGMKDHTKLCHGDFNPSNIVLDKNGNYHIIDWAHATQGNASADCARTYLLFMIEGKEELAQKYLELFSKTSEIEISTIQRWIPIVAGAELANNKESEREFLEKWISVMDYE